MRKADILTLRRELSRRMDLAEYQLRNLTGPGETDRRAELEGYIRATRDALGQLESTKSARLAP